MKRLVLVFVISSLVIAMAAAASAQGMKASAVPQVPEWQTIKSLAGNWEGFYEMDGKKAPAAVEMRATADGSAVMQLMAKDTPHEMVTMFHPDGSRLLATHYCAAHNQPRMALVKADTANQVRFDFVDGTNIKPGDTYMKRLVLTIVDADHHSETWTSMADGKETPPLTFVYTRKK